MNRTHIATNFIYPDIPETQYFFGASPVVSEVLREDGDWRDYLPPEEEQNKHGVESSACYIEAQQHVIATIEEESFGEKDNNYSARFNALLSDGSISGGDPLKGAESIRNDGMVKDSSMPFGDDIQSWDDFHSWKGVSKADVIIEGQKYLKDRTLNHEIVFKRDDSIQKKFEALRDALKRAPVAVSVTGWYESAGIYFKPENGQDNHLVECVYLDDENHMYIRDTYFPFLKMLESNYNSEFAMLWTIKKKEIKPPRWDIDLLNKLLDFAKSILTLDLQILKQKPMEPIKIDPPVIFPDPKDELRKQILLSIGKDASPKDLAPEELSCAEGVSNILNSVFPDFPDEILSTVDLHIQLKKSPHFKSTLNSDIFGVIVSPRTPEQPGHAGYIMGDGSVISNDSKTGTMQKNYTFDSWIAYFSKKKGLHVFLHELVV